ncbi:hypothetical protein IWQ60_002029 [Tieghemiomyces parasiticus]|uniref:Uncharacterized protein n=1 Tax=Tieghemiomyces parasiticus TaxID=78921 RepID=A0A9W8E1D8_9FUNG|nr:hypothetical protein IWQ60_002029 [Tieghemiomyces parasiticus]
MSSCLPGAWLTAVLQWAPFLPDFCALGWTATLSQLASGVSIACWVCALTPQILLNWRNGNAESLSLGFICIWLSGDACNLLGCFLTDQLPFQKLLGLYFCAFDTVLVLQISYYTWWAKPTVLPAAGNTTGLTPPFGAAPLVTPVSAIAGSVSDPARVTRSSKPLRPADASTPLLGLYQTTPAGETKLYHALVTDRHGRTVAVAQPLTPKSDTLSLRSVTGTPAAWYTRPRVLTLAGAALVAAGLLVWWVYPFAAPATETPDLDPVARLGQVVAWLCCALYLTSRLPQIYKNHQRRSVEGLSLSMFLFALNGNLFYFASILLLAQVSAPGLLLATLPYIIGSVGTVVQDLTILTQHATYSQRKVAASPADVIVVEEGLGAVPATISSLVSPSAPTPPSGTRLPRNASASSQKSLLLATGSSESLAAVDHDRLHSTAIPIPLKRDPLVETAPSFTDLSPSTLLGSCSTPYVSGTRKVSASTAVLANGEGTVGSEILPGLLAPVNRY